MGEPGGLHGRPDAPELIEAVHEFLLSLLPDLAADRAFHARVALRALEMVDRELRRGSAPQEEHAARLSALGFADLPSLAAAIRSGAVPPGLVPAVRSAVLEDVRARLAVSNPTYVESYR